MMRAHSLGLQKSRLILGRLEGFLRWGRITALVLEEFATLQFGILLLKQRADIALDFV